MREPQGNFNAPTSVFPHKPLPPSLGLKIFYKKIFFFKFICLGHVVPALMPEGGSGEQSQGRLLRQTPRQSVEVEAPSASRNQISCPRAVSMQET